MPSVLLTAANDYRFPPAPSEALLDRETWDAVMGGEGGIGPRLRLLEEIGTGIESFKLQLQQFGLAMLDEAVNPIIAEMVTQLEGLQADIQTQITAINSVVGDFQNKTDKIIADFQAVTAVNLEALADQIVSVEANLAAVQQEINTILAGGIPADKVQESAGRVFVTPEQRTEIGALRADLEAVQENLTQALQSLAGNLDGGTF